MKLRNLPPFKVGDRVTHIGGNSYSMIYTVYEVRYNNIPSTCKWQIRLGTWWYNADGFKRVNENTTEEAPSGAAVEENRITWTVRTVPCEPQRPSEVQSSGSPVTYNSGVTWTLSREQIRMFEEACQRAVRIPQGTADLYRWVTPGDTPPTTT